MGNIVYYSSGLDLFLSDSMFIMQFEDWFEIFTNLFISLDFPTEYSGLQIQDEFVAVRHINDARLVKLYLIG